MNCEKILITTLEKLATTFNWFTALKYDEHRKNANLLIFSTRSLSMCFDCNSLIVIGLAARKKRETNKTRYRKKKAHRN